MSYVATYILKEPRDRAFAIAAVQRAELGMQVKISKATRTVDQNRHYFGLLGQIAKQLHWPPDSNELHDIEWWSRRMTLGWLIDKKRSVEIITSLHGDEFGLLLPHTSSIPSDQFAELIEFTSHFGVENGVIFKERPEPPPRDD